MIILGYFFLFLNRIICQSHDREKGSCSMCKMCRYYEKSGHTCSLISLCIFLTNSLDFDESID